MGSILGPFKKVGTAYRALRNIEVHLKDLAHTQHHANRQIAFATQRRFQDPRSVVPFGGRVYSKSDEDGIIREIFRRIGTEHRFFVEFGVEGGLENNTLALLLDRWQGGWLEASPAHAATIREQFAPLLERSQLRFREAFVTAENIESLLAELQAPSDFDLLSIDVDGNDYWIWEAITAYRPRVVVIEYIRHLGPQADVKMPYVSDWTWRQSGRACGASLKAMENLGRAKGYNLVGCAYDGPNAFFVREDLTADLFAEPFTAEHHHQEPREGFVRKVGYDQIKAFFV